jgi:hypothetical protein
LNVKRKLEGSHPTTALLLENTESCGRLSG